MTSAPPAAAVSPEAAPSPAVAPGPPPASVTPAAALRALLSAAREGPPAAPPLPPSAPDDGLDPVRSQVHDLRQRMAGLDAQARRLLEATAIAKSMAHQSSALGRIAARQARAAQATVARAGLRPRSAPQPDAAPAPAPPAGPVPRSD